jgi:regulatory protein YycI of two-component signal transduction system YycFG
MKKSIDSYKQASSEGREGGEEKDNLICIYPAIESCYQVQLPLSC